VKGTTRAGTGAVRSNDVDDLRFDQIPPAAVRELARRFKLGLKYGVGNWLKGFPYSQVLYHLEAHLADFKEGVLEKHSGTEEGNLAAIMWACAALIEYRRRGRTDLDDRLFVLRPKCNRKPHRCIFHPNRRARRQRTHN
jgi:Domain of unknown function (DUF5664)